MVNSPTPAAARIAFTKASATGLRSTLAIPGRASSSEEICDPPSSADIELAAPALKVAPSYIGPTTPSRILHRFLAELSLRRAVTTLAQGLGKPALSRSAARDDEVGMGQELAQHRAGPPVGRRRPRFARAARIGGDPWSPPWATSGLRERYASSGRCQGGPPSRGCYISFLEVRKAVGRRGIKEYRAPEALALIAADREHVPLV